MDLHAIYPKVMVIVSGNWGGVLRRICAKRLFKYCAPDSNIEHMASFGSGKEVELGHHSGIGIHCHVPNNIKIGDNVMMGPKCYFLESDTHAFERIDIPMIQQGRKTVGRIIIGDDVWIGRETMVISGKKIGSHTIIGARSVVSKDIPDYVVAAGNPCQVKKQRKL
jgi:maltose O-acetyltransferase